MWPDVEALLPIPVTGSPEGLRVDYARNDLRIIAAKSQEQIAVHEYATKAAAGLLHTLATTEVPNKYKLTELNELYEKPDTDKKLTVGKVARQMVAPKQMKGSGVTDKDITRDVLSELHPDRVISGTSDAEESESIFRAITEARQYDDQTLAQSLYAGTVASRASAEEQPTATSLELARYKAWLALEAGKGRFYTKEEVDAWKKRELSLLPIRVRAGLLISARNLFGRALGAGADGSISLPSDYYHVISSGLDGSVKVIERVMGDHVTTDEMAKVDTDLFDQKMTGLLNQLDVLLRSQRGMGQTWTYLKGQLATTFVRDLTEIANILHGKTRAERLGAFAFRLGELAISDASRSTYGYEDEPKPIFPKDGFSEKDIIRNSIKKDRFKSEESYFKDKYNKY
jgi:hypothetical protein